jgi:hypothetical protein
MTRANRAKKKQRTVQMCAFAVSAHQETTKSLKENKVIVVSAAVLAFSRLPREEQIKACEEARRSHLGTAAAPVAGA